MLPVERDAVGDKVFSAFIPELFVISPRLDLFESLLAGLVEPGEGRRVLHLDNNPGVRVVWFNENVAEAVARFDIRHDKPCWVAPEKPEKESVVEILLLIVPRFGVKNADHSGHHEIKMLLNSFGVACLERLTEIPHRLVVPDEGFPESLLNLQDEYLADFAVWNNQPQLAVIGFAVLRQVSGGKQHAPEIVDAVVVSFMVKLLYHIFVRISSFFWLISF